MDSFTSNKKAEFLIINLPTKKILSPFGFTSKYYETFGEEITYLTNTSRQQKQYIHFPTCFMRSENFHIQTEKDI